LNVKRILVVDDQAMIRQLLEISLRAADRQIVLAESGEQALALVEEQSFNLVIMDIMMPGGMDGFETVACLRSAPQLCRCPVLILTAKDQRAERERADALGVEGYLVKPFRLQDLQEQVEKLMAMPPTMPF
jgi:CheY-like chemotaxis protein